MNNRKTSVLVINCDCILVNSSANLCHLAYLKGLVEADCSVTLLSKSKSGYRVDPDLSYPSGVNCILFSGMTLYEKLSAIKRRNQKNVPVSIETEVSAIENKKALIIKSLKKKLLSLYKDDGLHRIFLRKARKYTAEEVFDYVISLSTPITSHKLAYELISSGQVRHKHWIQLWEDPWYDDLFGFNKNEEVYQEEKRILDTAEKVCYVSPITVEKQKQLFPDAAKKMFWQPVPSYGNGANIAKTDHKGITFGYFGNYHPKVRDLGPFYKAAKAEEIDVSICGDPSGLFAPIDKIKLYPRMGIGDMRRLEENTDVLVFLCNRMGGQIPGKIYEYSETDRIILFIMDGTEEEQQVLKAFFGPLNRYVFCNNDTESIRAAIKRIKSGDLDGIRNEPVNCFASRDIVERILAMQ